MVNELADCGPAPDACFEWLSVYSHLDYKNEIKYISKMIFRLSLCVFVLLADASFALASAVRNDSAFVLQGELKESAEQVTRYSMSCDYAGDTIVSHMNICHKEIVVAYHSATRSCGTTTNGATFTDNIIVANNGSGVLSIEFQVLRDGRDNCSGENLAIFTNTGAGENGHIRANPSAVTNFYIFIDGGEIGYLYIFSYFSIGVQIV